MKKKSKDKYVGKENTIEIRYEIPDLLEAACGHPSCPQWLKHGLFDLFSNHTATISYSRHHWAAVLDGIKQEQEFASEVAQ